MGIHELKSNITAKQSDMASNAGRCFSPPTTEGVLRITKSFQIYLFNIIVLRIA